MYGRPEMNWKPLFGYVSRYAVTASFLTGLLLTGLLLTGCGPGSEPENRLAVAIWIGDEPITVDTFRQRVETTLKTCFIEQQFTDEEYALIVDQTIRDLVREKVIR